MGAAPLAAPASNYQITLLVDDTEQQDIMKGNCVVVEQGRYSNIRLVDTGVWPGVGTGSALGLAQGRCAYQGVFKLLTFCCMIWK